MAEPYEYDPKRMRESWAALDQSKYPFTLELYTEGGRKIHDDGHDSDEEDEDGEDAEDSEGTEESENAEDSENAEEDEED